MINFVMRMRQPCASRETKMTSAVARGVFIVAAKRTPFGAFGGALKALSATDLSVVASRAALAEGKVDPEVVDSVIVGNVVQVKQLPMSIRTIVYGE